MDKSTNPVILNVVQHCQIERVVHIYVRILLEMLNKYFEEECGFI
jgi:hypothetical protein